MGLRIFLILFLIFSLGFSDAIADKQKELKRIQAEIQRNQKLLQQTKVKENASLRDLALFNRSLNKAQSELRYNQQKLTQQTAELNKTNEELARNEAEHKRRQDLSKARIREIFKSQDAGFLTLFLTNRSFSDLAENAYYYRRLLRRDMSNIRQAQAVKQETAQKKTDLEYQKNIVESTKRSIEQQKNIYAQRAKQQEQITAQLRAQRQKYERESEILARNSRDIETMIKNMTSGTALGTGKYIWPVRGYITSPYGNRVHPVYKTAKMHTGLDIGGNASGTPIKAADAGVVILSQNYGGYGETVIIDHGRGYSTLYAHMSKRSVKKGAVIKQGQNIGNVGSTGISTGPHLHFEVRLNGATQDPRKYLP